MTAAILLAAGAATRMGRLKQLLPYKGESLVGHAVAQASLAKFQPIVVVVGAQADAVWKSMSSKTVELVLNENWEAGMGSSIAAGVRHLQKRGIQPGAVAVLLADQPLVESRHLKDMQACLEAGQALAAAAEYNNVLGVPAIFRATLFQQLASLPPEMGAKHLLRRLGGQVVPFPLPEAAVDVDTPEDFAALTS